MAEIRQALQRLEIIIRQNYHFFSGKKYKSNFPTLNGKLILCVLITAREE